MNSDAAARVLRYNEWASHKGFVEKAGTAATLCEHRGFISGTWHFGGNYRQISPFPGSYPIQYVERAKILFPEILKGNNLHIFAGSLAIPEWGLQKKYDIPGITLDLNTVKRYSPIMRPDVLANAENFTDSLSWKLWTKESGINRFDFVMADTIYNDRQAFEKYDVEKAPSRDAVIDQASKVTRPGGFLLWIDEMEPAHANAIWIHRVDITIRMGQKKFPRVFTVLERRA